MLKFRDLSIRKKLTILLVGTSTVAVVAACLSFYLLIVELYQQSYLDDLQSLVDITGENCSASLAFGIPEDAKHLLASLEGKPSITSATILDSNGNRLANYTRADFSHDSHTAKVYSGEQRVFQEIVLNGNVIGSITLFDDMRTIRNFKHIALAIVVVIVCVVLVLTALLAARLKEIVSRPITNLAEISRKISIGQDYSLRAKKESDDEVGSLVDAFNAMLGKISERTGDLEKSEQRFRALVDQAVDAFLLHDMEGQFIDVNQRACDSLGFTHEELLRLTMGGIDTEISNEQYRENYWNNLFPESSLTVESVFQRTDGTTFPVEMRLGLLELDQEKFVMVLARDITERLAAAEEKEEMQNRLQQAQKMESVGNLAGGIAHDFNNILAAVVGFTELAQMKVEPKSAVAKYLREVHKASQRASELVKQILTFSRRHEQEMRPVQISLVIKEALKLLRSSIPSTITISQDITAEAMVLADSTQIHQLIMNLCTNAYHAMQETGGIIAIALHEVVIDKQGISGFDLPPGQYVKIEVGDTGCGMDEETRNKIFEPYFTTKAQGKGTGLGLAVVHGIVKSHQGRITVYSEPGQGTSFCVYLPTITGGEIEEDVQQVIPTLIEGSERVMVVDDEEDIRNFLMELLESGGYKVDTFADGVEAWKAFSKEPDHWNLIITDQTMPVMTGAKLAKKVIELRPEMPVILCSGYSERINAQMAQELGIAVYLQKPIGVNDLFQCVRRVLESKGK